MTEVRLLYGSEIQWAVNVAREAFVAAMSNAVRSKEEIDRFYNEVTPERLWQEGNAGKLFPWGVFKEGGLCAVGAMQPDGRITMLYVRPDCQRRGMGLLLLNAMRDQAAALGLPRVTIEVTPVTLAPYFYKRGFAVAPNGTGGKGSVLLECRLCHQAQNMPNAPAGQQSGVPNNGMPVQMRNMPYMQPATQAADNLQNMRGENQPEYLQQMQGESQPEYLQQMQGINQPGDLQQKKEKDRLRVTYRKKKVSAKAVLLVATAALAVSFSVIAGITLYHLAAEERYTVKDYYETGVGDEL